MSVPSQPHQRPGPSTGWYWVAGVVVIVGLAAAVWFGVRGGQRFTASLQGFQRVDVPGEATVELDEAGGYYLYYEGGPVPGDLQVRISGAEGPVPTQPYVGDLTYALGGREGTAVATFDVPTPGSYLVATRSDRGGTVAVGRGVVGGVFGLVGGIFAAIAVAGLATVIAVAIVVTVAILRGRTRPPPPFPPPAA